MTTLCAEDLDTTPYTTGVNVPWISHNYSGIRIRHKPTGIVVQCDEHRSQHKNRAMCLLELSAKLKELEDEQIAERTERSV